MPFHLKQSLRRIKHTSFLSIPRTLYFNFKYLSFIEALKFPFYVYWRTELQKTKGKVKIESELHPGMIKIGFPNKAAAYPNYRKTAALWNVSGTVIFKGSAYINSGSMVEVQPEAELIFGDDFGMTGRSAIRCYKRIEFGRHCGISWDCIIMDSDFHPVIDMNSKIRLNEDREVILGDNVWVGYRCLIMKGAKIGNDCIVAAGTMITKKFEGNNQIVGGTPPGILRENIMWML